MKHYKFGTRKLGVLLSVVGLVGLAACRGGSPEERVDKFSKKIANKLDFNEQQKGLLAEIAQEVKKDMGEEKAVRLSMKDEVRKMILSSDLDQARIRTVIKERNARMESKIDKYLSKVTDLHKTLSPEQKNEILEKFDKFANHWD